MIKTNKTGVYYNLLEDGDKVFYFTYNDINDNKKKKWVKVGKYSDGIREINAFNLRAEQLSIMKHGTDITVIANKKKVNITTYDDLAQIYFNDKSKKDPPAPKISPESGIYAPFNEDGFIAKYDLDGDFIWAKKYGGIGIGEILQGINFDSNNNIID